MKPPEIAAVKEARTTWVNARETYVKAVKDADAAGFSSTVIAHAAGVTEAAVRQTLKRNP